MYNTYVIQKHYTDEFLGIQDGHYVWTPNINKATVLFICVEDAEAYWTEVKDRTGYANKPVDICELKVVTELLLFAESD